MRAVWENRIGEVCREYQVGELRIDDIEYIAQWRSAKVEGTER